MVLSRLTVLQATGSWAGGLGTRLEKAKKSLSSGYFSGVLIKYRGYRTFHQTNFIVNISTAILEFPDENYEIADNS